MRERVQEIKDGVKEGEEIKGRGKFDRTVRSPRQVKGVRE